LKPLEQPIDKLPLLYAFLGTSNPKEALLDLASRHVPGFRPACPLRNGGRKRVKRASDIAVAVKGKPTTKKRQAVEAASAAAELDEAWMCDLIDMYRAHEPKRKLAAIAYELSSAKPPAGCENPAYGRETKWIVQRYTNRKRYEAASTRRFERRIFSQMRAQTARHE
jgi:hypothetical protein